MMRLTACLIFAALLAISAAAFADGVPDRKRPTATRITQEKTVRETVIISGKEVVPPVVVTPAPPPPSPPLVWVPGHWTWNSAMDMHVWIPGMFIEPPPPTTGLVPAAVVQRIEEWIGLAPRRY